MAWLVQLFRTFVYGNQVPQEQIRGSVLAHLRVNGVSSPQLMSADLRQDLGDVDTACAFLERDGWIRRSANQIDRAVVVENDGRQHIPSPYVRYELVS